MQGLRGTVEATFDVTSVMTIPAPRQAGQVLDRQLLENALDNISNRKCVWHKPFQYLQLCLLVFYANDRLFTFSEHELCTRCGHSAAEWTAIRKIRMT